MTSQAMLVNDSDSMTSVNLSEKKNRKEPNNETVPWSGETKLGGHAGRLNKGK